MNSRPKLTAPDGRQYTGRWPQSLPDRGEWPYIKSLAAQLHGVCEVRLAVGRADVVTTQQVFEVEPARSWRTGAQQAFAYSGMSGLSPALALFGNGTDYLEIYLKVRDLMPGLELWVWDGITRWDRVTSRVRASHVMTKIRHGRATDSHEGCSGR